MSFSEHIRKAKELTSTLRKEEHVKSNKVEQKVEKALKYKTGTGKKDSEIKSQFFKKINEISKLLVHCLRNNKVLKSLPLGF